MSINVPFSLIIPITEAAPCPPPDGDIVDAMRLAIAAHDFTEYTADSLAAIKEVLSRVEFVGTAVGEQCPEEGICGDDPGDTIWSVQGLIYDTPDPDPDDPGICAGDAMTMCVLSAWVIANRQGQWGFGDPKAIIWNAGRGTQVMAKGGQS